MQYKLNIISLEDGENMVQSQFFKVYFGKFLDVEKVKLKSK